MRHQEEINCRKIEKVIQIKFVELCKTRTKESSPDMFNFFVDLVGHGMVTDTGRGATFRSKFRAPPLQIKIQKMKVLPKT